MQEPIEKLPGVIINAGAGTVLRDPELIERIRRQLPRPCVHVTRSIDEVAPALVGLSERGVRTLFVVGGDGSITGTLSELVRVWTRDPLPEVVLTRGGTINTIAGSLGARGRPDAMLDRFLSGAAGPCTERPLVRVRADGHERHGLIFALGAAARWLEAYYEGASGPAAAAGLVARVLASVPVRGALARRLFTPIQARLELDDRIVEDAITVAGGASVRHVGLGFAPFRSAGQRKDRFHWLWTNASAFRLVREFPLFAAGVYSDRGCLQHASVRRVRLDLASSEPFTVDGDLFPAARELLVETGPLLRFFAP